ncbi:histidine--tRNA ligase [Archaeoglobus profundus]|uniref:Histidine--tRNA ligase n=1 Tax=Archaeoglobus profundus (strain DSM 5631 / JCM 9629 / NBRC 100127 / Av18) TaxID=572546 RepID=D2REV0_ARCPA|nr:histidine--tRNA ligase [Archaeoglobus profundus]ADB58644.1 histidyl-tRNA synthetase [Archaeoglobus profundus DSM 5631]
MRIERPRGTRDFLPDEMEKRRAIEKVMRRIAESYGYREVLTPTFEHLELFTIKSGEGIVEEIYAFKDKSGRDLALRPELTAPVMRMYVNECMGMPKPLRFYYFANCFRYERPQKGRYREFWQFGVELIGSDSYLADVEVISLAYEIMSALNIKFDLHVGHVGLLRHVLRDLDEKVAGKIMRLIDKKDLDTLDSYINEIGREDLKEVVYPLIELVGDTDIIEEAREIIPDFDFTHIEKVAKTLDDLGVEFKIDLGIARGLDYYTGIVFEAYAEGLGAQNQICGGGSYRLAHLFGGDDVPATGFALGFDRIAEICEVDVEKPTKVVIVSFRGLEKEALKIANAIRSKAVTITDVMERSVKKQLSFANDISADYAVIVGEKELKEGKIAVKNLRTQEQSVMTLDEFLNKL